MTEPLFCQDITIKVAPNCGGNSVGLSASRDKLGSNIQSYILMQSVQSVQRCIIFVLQFKYW